eukprot:4863967-Pleurochrysis_carterae.AAC.3
MCKVSKASCLLVYYHRFAVVAVNSATKLYPSHCLTEMDTACVKFISQSHANRDAFAAPCCGEFLKSWKDTY